MRYKWLGAVAALLINDPVAAQPSAGAGQRAASPQTGIEVVGKQREGDKKVCVRSIPTGSIMAQTVCKPQSEWEYEKQQTMAALQEVKDRQIREQNARLLMQNGGKGGN